MASSDPARHASGKSLDQLFHPVQQAYAAQNFLDSRIQSGAMQSVEVSLVPQVLVGGKLLVNTLSLKDDTNLTAERGRILGGVEAHDQSPAGRGNHQGGKNAEKGRLPATVGAQQAKKLSGTDFERNVVERSAALVAVNDALHRNHRAGGGLRFGAYFLVYGCFGSHRVFYDEIRFSIMRTNRRGR